MVEYAACSMLLEHAKWSLAMFQVEETQRPITCMRPGIVSVVPFHIASEPQVFWPPPTTKRRKTSRPSHTRASTSSQSMPLEDSGGWAPAMSDQVDEHDIDEGGSVSSAGEEALVDLDELHELLDANVCEDSFNVDTIAKFEAMEERDEMVVQNDSDVTPPVPAVPVAVVDEPAIPQDDAQAPLPQVAPDVPQAQEAPPVAAVLPPRRHAPRGANTAAAITVITDE